MNKESQINELKKSTEKWLSVAIDEHIENIIKDDIEGLRNCLRFHENRYYVQNVKNSTRISLQVIPPLNG